MNSMNCYILCHFQLLAMLNTIVGARAASRYGSGSDQMIRLQLRLPNTAFFLFPKKFTTLSRKFLQKSEFFVFAKVFAKIRVFRFRENFTIFSRKFSRKSESFVFAKIFAKIIRDFRENFRENEIFSRNEIS
jgi:hypothetical protein